MTQKAQIQYALWAAFYLCVGILASVYACSVLERAYGGYCVGRYWHPPSKPYTASVIGFPIGGQGRHGSRATVRVAYADGRSVEFTTPRIGGFVEGQAVRVLVTTDESRIVDHGRTIARRVFEVYDVDNAYYLWGEDLVAGVLLVAVALTCPWAAFRPIRAAQREIREGPPILGA